MAINEKHIFGIDLGATNIKFSLIYKGRIISKKILPTRNFPSREDLIRALGHTIEEILSEANVLKKNVLGIGIGLPGPIDSLKGIVHYFPNIPGWRNVRLRDILEKKTGLPVFIDNDANLMTLAEARIGSAKGKTNVIGITLGTGVGGGIIVHGKLYRGSSLTAGEIGHIPLNESGPECPCGGTACLERYVGNSRILNQAKKSFGETISLEELSRLAKGGNEKAKKIWENAAQHLGIALSGVVNFFNPDTIVIGGGVANAGEIIFDTVRKVIRMRSMPTSAGTVRIVKAKLGNDAGMIGAGLLVKEEIHPALTQSHKGGVHKK